MQFDWLSAIQRRVSECAERLKAAGDLEAWTVISGLEDLVRIREREANDLRPDDVGLMEERRQFTARIRQLEAALKIAQELLARNGIQRPEIDAALAAAEDGL